MHGMSYGYGFWKQLDEICGPGCSPKRFWRPQAANVYFTETTKIACDEDQKLKFDQRGFLLFRTRRVFAWVSTKNVQILGKAQDFVVLPYLFIAKHM